jgi:hypothetical protein
MHSINPSMIGVHETAALASLEETKKEVWESEMFERGKKKEAFETYSSNAFTNSRESLICLNNGTNLYLVLERMLMKQKFVSVTQTDTERKSTTFQMRHRIGPIRRAPMAQIVWHGAAISCRIQHFRYLWRYLRKFTPEWHQHRRI